MGKDLIEQAKAINDVEFKKQQLDIIRHGLKSLDDENIRHQNNTEYIQQSINKAVAAKKMSELPYVNGGMCGDAVLGAAVRR